MDRNNGYIDVTSFVSRNRFTGIQRLLGTVLRNNRVFKLALYKDSAFYVLNQTPKFASKSRSSLSQRALSLTLVWSVVASLRNFPVLEPVFQFLRRVATLIFESKISNNFVNAEPTSAKQEVSASGSDLWLLDVPRDLGHIEALESFVDEAGTSLHIYLYDLIPVEPSELGGESVSSRDQLLYRRYLQLACKAKTILFLSMYTQERFEHYLEGQGLSTTATKKVLYPAWDERFEGVGGRHEPSASTRLANFLFREPEKKIVFAVAPLSKRKNLRPAIQAVRRILARESFLKLIVLAPGTASPDFWTVWELWSAKRKFPGNIHFEPSVSESELHECYSKAHICVVPSKLEGFGLPIIEAANFGCHVISSDIEVFREISTMVPIHFAAADDSAAWEDKILELVRMDRPHRISGKSVLPSGSEVVRIMEELTWK